MNFKNNKIKTITIILSAVAIIVLALFGKNQISHRNAYKLAIEYSCNKDYKNALYEIQKLPDGYKETNKLRRYISIIQSFDENDREKYDTVLHSLKAIKSFSSADLNEGYNKSLLKIAVLYEEYVYDKKEAATIDAEIANGIPDIVDIQLSDKSSIEQIRADYDSADISVQSLVSNEPMIEQAEQKIEHLEQANKVIKKIDAIGEVTLNSGKRIRTARKAYNSLTDEEKEYVTNVKVLKAARTEYAKQRANRVVVLISSIGAISSSSEGKIRAAESAYNNLSSREKKYVTNISTLNKARDNFESLQNASQNSEPSYTGGGTYYWTPGGSVYHTTKNCPTLSRSSNILSGSPPSGRRVCRVCS